MPYFGIQSDNGYFVLTRLPMGAVTSVFVASAIT
jgi:hypothetical protein